MSRFPLLAILALLTVVAFGPRLEAQDHKAKVLEVGQALFDAMSRRDTAALRKVVHPSLVLVAAAEVDGKPEPRISGTEQFLQQIANFPTVPIERMWNAEVRVSGTIAAIWTQYDFYRGAESVIAASTASSWSRPRPAGR